MWEKIFDFLKNIFSFSLRIDRLEKDVEKLTAENKMLAELIHQQRAEIKVLVYAVQSESDKTRMWVEKELVKFERRLTAGEVKEDDEKKN
jgi:hypothetical protein